MVIMILNILYFSEFATDDNNNKKPYYYKYDWIDGAEKLERYELGWLDLPNINT